MGITGSTVCPARGLGSPVGLACAQKWGWETLLGAGYCFKQLVRRVAGDDPADDFGR